MRKFSNEYVIYSVFVFDNLKEIYLNHSVSWIYLKAVAYKYDGRVCRFPRAAQWTEVGPPCVRIIYSIVRCQRDCTCDIGTLYATSRHCFITSLMSLPVSDFNRCLYFYTRVACAIKYGSKIKYSRHWALPPERCQ